MSSHNRATTRKVVFLGLLAAIAIVLSYFERFIPLPTSITGMKLGLANVVTVTCLYKFKWNESLLVVLIRVFVTGLIIGSVTSFIYSFTGGIVSFIGMSLVLKIGDKYVTPIGVSILGAYLHIVGQLVILSLFTGRITIAVSYGPMLLVTSLLTGFFVGIASLVFLSHLTRLNRTIHIPFKN